MKNRKWFWLAGLTIALIAVLVLVPTIIAQGPGNGRGPGDGYGPGMRNGPYGPGPMGHRGGRFGGEFSLMGVAADALDMERADLIAELQSGKTVADVAEEKGVVLATIIEAFTTPRSAWLAERVEAGFLTQEAANAKVATMTAHVVERLTGEWSPRGFGPGAGFMDEDGDGVCDHGGYGRMGYGRGRWGR